MTFTDAVKCVMELSGAVREYWDRELPRRHPRWPLVDPDADDGPPPPEQAELERFLASLPEQWLYALAALDRLGMGLLPAADPVKKCEEVRGEFTGPEHAARFLALTFTLAEHLELALERLAEVGLVPEALLHSVALAG